MPEARPGREQDGGAELGAGGEVQGFDGGVRVEEVGEEAEGQVRAGGVAADEDVGGRVVEGGGYVAEEGDGLL